MTEQTSIPIIPGSPAEWSQSGSPEVYAPWPPRAKRPRWVIPLIAMSAALLVAAGGVCFYLATEGGLSTVAAAIDPKPLQDAYGTCGSIGELSDEGRTLYLDMSGTDGGSGVLGWGVTSCVLEALKTPTWVIREMQSTRALDGRQSQRWGSIEASWTYHPDHGLDVLLRDIS